MKKASKKGKIEAREKRNEKAESMLVSAGEREALNRGLAELMRKPGLSAVAAAFVYEEPQGPDKFATSVQLIVGGHAEETMLAYAKLAQDLAEKLCDRRDEALEVESDSAHAKTVVGLVRRVRYD